MEHALSVLAVTAICVVGIAGIGAWIASVIDFIGRRDIVPGERFTWAIALILFPPVSGIVYLWCGPGEERFWSALGRPVAEPE